jgi:hypothetical protein
MSIYVQIDDFVGQFKLPKDKYSIVDLQSYLDKYEVLYLQNLLGCEMYELFKTNYLLGPPPTDPRFLDIWNPFCKDLSLGGSCGYYNGYDFYDEINCPKQLISQGIKEMLLGFIYWEFVGDIGVKVDIGGIYKNEQANGSLATFEQSKLYKNYNQSNDTYCAIQYCICLNPNSYDYSKYNGIKKDKAIFI